MTTFIYVLASFLLPFITLPIVRLWRNKTTEGIFFVFIASVFLWGTAIVSLLFYLGAKYLFNCAALNYWKFYLIGFLFCLMLLIGWLILKRIYKIR